MNCPLCSRVLEPATLRKGNLWCSVCATEFLADGKTAAPEYPPPVPASVTAPDTFAETAQAIVDKGPVVQRIVDASRPLQSATKTFQVTVGDVTFEATGKVELTIGKTKVTVT